MLEAATEDNRRGLESAVDIVAQRMEILLADVRDQAELRRAADRATIQEAAEASKARMMKVVSGILKHLSEELRRQKCKTLIEIERVRQIAHKDGSAADDMAGAYTS